MTSIFRAPFALILMLISMVVGGMFVVGGALFVVFLRFLPIWITIAMFVVGFYAQEWFF